MSLKDQHGSVNVNHAASAEVASPLWRLVSRRERSIVTFNDSGSGPAFYCIHSVTGDVTLLQHLAQALGPEHKIYGIQVPKAKMTGAFAASIKTIARYHVDTISAFQPVGPMVLGGWSTGAIVALEMAQQLRAMDRNVLLLVALDGAPCNTGAGISPWNPKYYLRLIANIPYWIKDDQQKDWSLRVFTKRVAARFAFRFRMAGRALANNQTQQGNIVQNILDKAGWSSEQTAFVRALYNAGLAYVPEVYEGPVLLYEARVQPLFHLVQLAAAWKKIAKQTEIVPIEGGHGSMFKEPSVGVLAADLSARLAELRHAEAEASGSRAMLKNASIS